MLLSRLLSSLFRHPVFVVLQILRSKRCNQAWPSTTEGWKLLPLMYT